MRLLVTGATGFIGSRLTARAIAAGHAVAALTRDASRASALAELGASVVEGDVSSLRPESIAPALGELDAVVHLAASLDYFGDPAALARANVDATRNVLDLAAACGASTFVLASSIEAQGPVALADAPAPESLPARPVSAYGQSKLDAEELARASAAPSLRILRYANVYGDGPSFLLPMVEALERGGPLIDFLPQTAERRLHPVHVDDTVEATLAALAPERPAGTFSIAGPEAVAFRDLFVKLARALERDAGPLERVRPRAPGLRLRLRQRKAKRRGRADLLAYLMAGEGDRVHRAYATDAATRELGFRPAVDLDSGLARCLEWASGRP